MPTHARRTSNPSSRLLAVEFWRAGENMEHEYQSRYLRVVSRVLMVKSKLNDLKRLRRQQRYLELIASKDCSGQSVQLNGSADEVREWTLMAFNPTPCGE